MTQSEAYISLPRPRQLRVILGVGILWFYNLLFAFAMPKPNSAFSSKSELHHAGP